MKKETKEYVIEKKIDSQLGIQTIGRNDEHSDTHRYPYEATSYAVLDRLIDSEYLCSEDVVMDYGCGMGRVPIYLYSRLGCNGYGIEFVEEFFERACENAKAAGCEAQVKFACGAAEKYELPTDVTACFFFNPFDIGIMRGVMKRILRSYDEMPRDIRLFFYYPQDEYIAFLSMIPELDFVDEIDCMELFEGDDNRNRIMIFEIE